MVAIIFVVACLLTYVFHKKKREIERFPTNKGLAFLFYKNSLDFLIPLDFVLLFYCSLALLSIAAAEFASVQALIQLETVFAKLKSFFSIFKLNTIYVFFILLFIYLLGILLLPSQKTKKVFKIFDKYQTITRMIYIVLVLLCSFTLLGTELGKPTNDIRVRINTIRSGYADVYNDVYEAMSEEAASKVYSNALINLPPSYQSAIALPAKIQKEAGDLREYYKTAQAQYGLKDRSIEVFLDKVQTSAGKSTQKGIIETNNHKSIKKTHITEDDMQQVSYRKINKARKDLTLYRTRLRSRVVELLKFEGGDKVASQFPKIFTYETKKVLFSQLTTEYPILDPIIEVFSRTIDKEMENEIERAVSRVTKSAIQSPKTIEKTIPDEASKIVQQKNAIVSPGAVEKANDIKFQLERQLSSIKTSKGMIDAQKNQVETARITKLIAQLKSPKESVRKTAAQNLSDMGPNLSQTKVKEVIDIMRHGNTKWITSRTRQEGHHCTDYEYTSIRYYAATAISDMKSPYVSSAISQEARQRQSDGITSERVTDPGWV